MKLYRLILLLSLILSFAGTIRAQASVAVQGLANLQAPGYNGLTLGGLQKSVAGTMAGYGASARAAIPIVGPISALFEYAHTITPGEADSFLLGAELRQRRSSQLQLFEYGLVGIQRSTNTANVTANFGGLQIAKSSAAAALGVGLDWMPTKHLGLRLADVSGQYAEYALTNTRFSGRFSAGVVFKF